MNQEKNHRLNKSDENNMDEFVNQYENKTINSELLADMNIVLA